MANKEKSLERRRASWAPEYTFVTETVQSEARSHAMREHWKRRHQRNEEAKASQQNRSLRALLPRSMDSGTSHVPLTAGSGSCSISSDSGGRPDAAQGQDRRPSISTQLLSSLGCVLSSFKPDPFQTCPVHLTSQHQKLLFHWITSHAAMMFEDLDVKEFNPMKDVWFPLDLSNASSFNCIMAHSAAHLAHLYTGSPPRKGTNSSDALQFKAEAVRILLSWVGDPDKELSDNSFAAVVRLLTFERYWGTVEDWQIHRDGLQRMIDAKGGVQALHQNWRLELVVYLVSLMSRPTWFEYTNKLDEISQPPVSAPTTHQVSSLDIQKVRCLWLVSFIQDMRTFMGSFYAKGLSSFPSTRRAVGLLRRSFQQLESSPSPDARLAPWEGDMLQCLFAISVLMQESSSVLIDGDSRTLTSSIPLGELELFLRDSEHIWGESIQSLRSILCESLIRLFAEGELKLGYVLDVVQVLGTLSLEARRGVEKCLLNLLYCLGNGNNNGTLLADDGWTPDSLLSSMHGH